MCLTVRLYAKDILVSILLLAYTNANIVNECSTFMDKRSILIQSFAMTDHSSLGMFLRRMLYAIRGSIVVTNHGHSQLLYLLHISLYFSLSI